MRVQIVGIPWYRRDDYPAIRRVMEDGHNLPPTFDAWERKAQEVLEHFQGKGMVTVKANIDSRTFPSWCRERGLKVDSAARTEYANRIAFEAHRHGGG